MERKRRAAPGRGCSVSLPDPYDTPSKRRTPGHFSTRPEDFPASSDSMEIDAGPIAETDCDAEPLVNADTAALQTPARMASEPVTEPSGVVNGGRCLRCDAPTTSTVTSVSAKSDWQFVNLNKNDLSPPNRLWRQGDYCCETCRGLIRLAKGQPACCFRCERRIRPSLSARRMREHYLVYACAYFHLQQIT